MSPTSTPLSVFGFGLLTTLAPQALALDPPVTKTPDSPNVEEGVEASSKSSETPATPAPSDAPQADQQLTPPSLTKDAQPVYPKKAEEEGLAAVVVLDIDIDASGKVENALIARASEHKDYGFEAAALAAAKQLEFKPAFLGEQAVPVRISYRFRFEPKVEPPPEPPARVKEEPKAPPVGELRGELTERGTRLPLSGVTVTLFRGEGADATGFETETDEKGQFYFEGLTPGDWKLLADPEGYFPVRTTEAVKPSKRTQVTYRIEKRSYNQYDVLVETDRVKRDVSHISIDAKRAERIPGTFGDVLAVVQNFPGVARTSGGELVIRGAAPEDSRIFVNGIDVPLIYHFGGLRSVMPVGMIERIDFYPGNYSVKYGRATGGIVDVDLKDLAPKKIGGYLDVNLFDTSAYLEAPITDDFSLAIAGRRSYIDAILNAVLPDTGDNLVAPRYFDAHALASYRPSSAHSMEAFFMVSGDEFSIVFDEPQVENATTVISDIGYSVDFYRGMGEYQYTPNDKFQNELKFSFGRDIFQFNVGSGLFANQELFQWQVRNTAGYNFSDAFALRAGVDYVGQHNDYELRIPVLEEEGSPTREQADGDGLLTADTQYARAEGYNHSTGAFVELDIRPYESLLLVPGLRLDHFTRTDKFFASPRITARQELGEKWALKGGVGLFTQEPQFHESDKDIGTDTLTLEKAVHYSGGVEYRPLSHINLEVTGFYKTLHDIVGPAANNEIEQGAGIAGRYNNGASGRVVGMEISARHEMSDNFYGWLAYTLSRSERMDDGSDEYRLFDFDQSHILTLVGAYQLPRNWEVSARYRLVSGNLYTPITGATYNTDTNEYASIPGSVNSARLDAFQQVDFRIDKRWIYDTWILSAYLDIQNVTNQRNQEGISYNFDFTETESSYGLPILPVLGLRGEF